MVDTRIGSGSDHTVFLNFLGRPTIGLTFEGPYGVYHSVYDSFYWMNRFGDPGYRYHILLAQAWGVIALRLANAEVLPFDFAFYAMNIRQFLEALTKGKYSRRELDLQPVLRGIAQLQKAGDVLKQAVDSRLAAGPLDPAVAGPLNQCLMAFEGNWLNPEGIPGRPWFKHMLYAARYTYAHLELPGLTEAVESGDWKTAQDQARLLENALAKNAELLRQAASKLTAQRHWVGPEQIIALKRDRPEMGRKKQS
jgi:N-acetylated-alpha-linked acidic dipeptidase